MWPRLAPHELLHDLYGARPLLVAAGQGVLTPAEQTLLYRPRSRVARRGPVDRGRRRAGRRGEGDPRPAAGEVPPEPAGQPRAARAGPRRGRLLAVGARAEPDAGRRRKGGRRGRDPVVRPHRRRRGPGPLAAPAPDARPPLALRLDDRRRRHRPGDRSVGAVGLGGDRRPPDADERAPPDRADGQLPDAGRGRRGSGRRPGRRRAGGGAAEAGPAVRPPADGHRGTTGRAGRSGGRGRRAGGRRGGARTGRGARPRPAPRGDPAGIGGPGDGAVDPRDPRGPGLAASLVVLPADEANGLEFDSVVVVEPALVAAGDGAGREGPPVPTTRGLRALYVALTRPTQRMAVVHSLPLPTGLALG